jgi:hypothetical protein
MIKIVFAGQRMKINFDIKLLVNAEKGYSKPCKRLRQHDKSSEKNVPAKIRLIFIYPIVRFVTENDSIS